MSGELTREQVDLLAGATVLEFGASWCGFCHAARPLFRQAFASHADVRHIQIEDGKGKRLGRSFRAKLWPTFIFLRDGQEVARVVRPHSAEQLADALHRVTDYCASSASSSSPSKTSSST